jgi:hypothetical protein
VRRSLQCFPVLLFLLGAVVAAPPSSATTVPHTPAQQLLSDALNAAQDAGSMHFVDKTTVDKKVQTLEGYISAPIAGEALTGSVAPLQVELIDGSIYVIGSAQGIQQALQITASQAAPFAQKWIVVSSSDPPFKSLTQDLTMASTIDSFTPGQAGLRLGREQRIGPDKVIPLVGRPHDLPPGTSGSTALFVSPKAPHLPLGGSLVLASKAGRLREIAVFNDWGAKVSLTAPTSGTPFSTVLADNPSS